MSDLSVASEGGVVALVTTVLVGLAGAFKFNQRLNAMELQVQTLTEGQIKLREKVDAGLRDQAASLALVKASTGPLKPVIAHAVSDEIGQYTERLISLRNDLATLRDQLPPRRSR